MSDLDIFIGWHCTGVMGHRKHVCGEPCAWCRDQASNDIASIRASGYVVVPREPTEAMISALQSYAQCAGYIEEGYRAMIAEATRKEDGE